VCVYIYIYIYVCVCFNDFPVLCCKDQWEVEGKWIFT